jgi:bisphosphoglycerate-dependent phosphoglycerate mutase
MRKENAIGRLIIIRHTQSIGNKENYYSGFLDIPLTAQGEEEARTGADNLKAYLQDNHLTIDTVFTSDLVRAKKTAQLTLETLGLENLPLIEREDLKERSYGLLEGKNKTTTAEILSAVAKSMEDISFSDFQNDAAIRSIIENCIPAGYLTDDAEHNDLFLEKFTLSVQEAAQNSENPLNAIAGLAQEWRRGYLVIPPAAESLEMVAQRTMSVYDKDIKPLLEQGQNVMVVAHNNSLRGLVYGIQGYNPLSIRQEDGFFAAVPEVIEFDEQMQPAHFQRCNLRNYAMEHEFIQQSTRS